MGLIIGKAGANIKAIQNSTGCEIKMLEGGNINISGTVHSNIYVILCSQPYAFAVERQRIAVPIIECVLLFT
jgi:KH domain